MPSKIKISLISRSQVVATTNGLSCDNAGMKGLKVGLTSLLLTLTCVISATADNSMLWSTSIGYNGVKVNPGTDMQSLPSYIRLRDITFSVPKINPDVLIVGIRFDETFDATPLSVDKKVSTGLRLFSPSANCVFDESCTKYVYIQAPSNWGLKYPTIPTTNTVPTYYLGKGDNSSNSLTDAKCPAPWWIDNSDPLHSAIDFQLSITCLNLPNDTYAYAFAGADIGVTPTPYNFTTTSHALNPYWSLAASAFASHGSSSVGSPYITPPPQAVPNYVLCKKGTVTKKIVGAKSVCPKGFVKQGLISASTQ